MRSATKTEQSKQKRPLSEKMARNCEEAKGGVCHCRCNGAYHGRSASKAEGGALPLGFYNELPANDPHWLPNEEQKEAKQKESYEARKLKAKLATAGKWHVYNGRCASFEPIELSTEEAAKRVRHMSSYCRYFGCKNCEQVESIYR